MVDGEDEEKGDIIMELRDAGHGYAADEVGEFTVEDARAAYERIMGRPWVMQPTMLTTRVVLEITYDRRITEHPASWNWQDLLTAEVGETATIVQVD